MEKLVDIRTPDPDVLRDTVGSLADWLLRLARGEDNRAVISEHEPKSSGSENTFAQDLTDVNEMRSEVVTMARDAASWLTKRVLYARTVTIKVRYHDFTTITRSHTEEPTRDEENIVRRAVALLDRTDAATRAVRLLGVSVHNLSETLIAVPENPQVRLPFGEC